MKMKHFYSFFTPMKKILLIEDNREISQNIKEYLELEHFHVTQAFDGETGIERATREDYDMILLDLMLPGVDGVSIARRVRLKKGTPIIMITARESLSDRLEWFEVGAVDYLVKPFHLKELYARILVHIGKKQPLSSWEENSTLIHIGNIDIDLAKHTFFKEAQEIHLTQKEFLIFEKLLLEKERVVTRGDIIEYLWGENGLFEGGDNKLDVYISNIRAKLGKNIIKTIKSVGYTLWDGD